MQSEEEGHGSHGSIRRSEQCTKGHYVPIGTSMGPVLEFRDAHVVVALATAVASCRNHGARLHCCPDGRHSLSLFGPFGNRERLRIGVIVHRQNPEQRTSLSSISIQRRCNPQWRDDRVVKHLLGTMSEPKASRYPHVSFGSSSCPLTHSEYEVTNRRNRCPSARLDHARPLGKKMFAIVTSQDRPLIKYIPQRLGCHAKCKCGKV